MSSKPMEKRSAGPPGAQVVALRWGAQSNGMTRLSKPPHDQPMPNNSSPSSIAATATFETGFKTTLKRPEAPVKSRFHSAWPGQQGKAGCSTRATSSRVCSHCAIAIACRSASRRRSSIVRRPRSARNTSSGPGWMPMMSVLAWRRLNHRSLAVTSPSRMSEWPPKYLVPASMQMSTPCSWGMKFSGVAQVLSRMTQMPRFAASAAMAGTSCTSIDCDPGDSTTIALVFARNSAAMSAPSAGS